MASRHNRDSGSMSTAMVPSFVGTAAAFLLAGAAIVWLTTTGEIGDWWRTH